MRLTELQFCHTPPRSKWFLSQPTEVVLALAGHYSGGKAITVKSISDGVSDCPYSHTLVVTVDRCPRIVTAITGNIAKQSEIKLFVKAYNYNHLMPSRCSVGFLWTKLVNKDVFRDPALKQKARWETQIKSEGRYKTGQEQVLPQKLRFWIVLFYSLNI
ncbi:large ribosomal subunit protein eL27-like [Ochotona princeps]|uniref:large ribosomal subunit protein eL27-like n=1 Tax=Ochotona princeps TaxID=9978 RepID=UPI002714E514|nr:large ribosomal subunit protein eL27-like [Ochotona princeps]